MQYDRMISYVYKCEKGNKTKNAGYVKMDIRDNKCRLYLNLHTDSEEKLGVYLYYYKKDMKRRVYLGNAFSVRGVIEYKDVLWMDNVNNTTKAFSQYNGLLLAASDEESEQYITQWKDEIEEVEDEIEETKEDVTEEIEEEVTKVQEETVEKDIELVTQESNTEIFEEIFANREDILAFSDDLYYNCVEIDENDIEKNPLLSKYIYNNSFAMHGYYKYRHLLAGKIADNEKAIFIGVPGSFSNREKMLASIFGCDSFKRSQRGDVRYPNFGYWCFELTKE